MKKNILFVIILAYHSLTFGLDNISFSFFSKKLFRGTKTSNSGRYYYSNGNIITRILKPKELFILTNIVGESEVYDPLTNSVTRSQKKITATETNPLFYFFMRKTIDMGLKTNGFKMTDSRIEQKLLVSKWEMTQKTNNSNLRIEAELVHKDNNPIYLSYIVNGKIIEKNYYSNYYSISVNFRLPSVLTNISYLEGDSIITKTEYNDIRINNNADNPYFDFKIPPHAKTQK